MRTIYYLIQKEFLQIFRDNAMLFIILAVPIVQLVVLSYTATFELKETPFHLVDFDQSHFSRQVVDTFEATDHFSVEGGSHNIDEGVRRILDHRAEMVLVIPDRSGERVQTGKKTNLQILVNAVDGNRAGLIQSYSQSIIRRVAQNVEPVVSKIRPSMEQEPPLEIVSSYRFNRQLDYIIYMVPGIIAVLVTLICLLLSVLNIVREKEIGTIEQINVTPIRKYQFLIGKLVPTWMIAMLMMMLGLAIAYLWFEVPFRGNVLLIFGTAAVYLLGIQGLGLYISSIADTQQQAMFINFFFFMIFLLMGGVFTPIDSMPAWAQTLTLGNPIAYFSEILRMVLLKGAGWSAIQSELTGITLMSLILMPLALFSYRKRLK